MIDLINTYAPLSYGVMPMVVMILAVLIYLLYAEVLLWRSKRRLNQRHREAREAREPRGDAKRTS